MTINEEALIEPQNTRSLEIIGIAVILTILFHFLPADRPFGIAFGLFAICLATGMMAIAALGKNR